MQEQTAQLHRQFLEGQETAHRTVHLLVEQHQRYLQAALGAAPTPRRLCRRRAAAGLAVFAGRVAAPPRRPAPSRRLPPAPAPVADNRRSRKGAFGGDRGEDGLPGGDAGPGHGAGRRPGHRLDQARRDPVGLAGAPARGAAGQAGAPRHAAQPRATSPPSSPAAKRRRSGRQPPDTRHRRRCHQGADAPRSPGDLEKVTAALLEVIAEKTGYPAEMLELDMALDADLGIDSIKRVEILSALQERLPEAPQVKPEHLGTLHSLRQIAAFLAGGDERAASGGRQPPDAGAVGDRIRIRGLTPPARRRRAGAQRRVAPCRWTGRRRGPMHLAPGAEIWMTSDDADLAGRVGERLRQKGYPHAPGAGRRPAQHGTAGRTRRAGRCWRRRARPTTRFLKDALFARPARRREPAPRRPGRRCALRHRLADGRRLRLRRPRRRGATRWTAASPGWRRRPAGNGRRCSARRSTSAATWPTRIRPPTRWSRNCCWPARRKSVCPARAAHPRPRRAAARRRQRRPPFAPGDVIVATGGARGVTAEAAVALARAYRPTLVLLGRSPAPERGTGLAGAADRRGRDQAGAGHRTSTATPRPG